MNKRKQPRADSQFVHIRIACEETGLAYSHLYGACTRGEIATMRVAGDGQPAKGAPILLLRSSLQQWIARRITKAAA